jgi:polar amino acid transport system substrate-binding protein
MTNSGRRAHLGLLAVGAVVAVALSGCATKAGTGTVSSASLSASGVTPSSSSSSADAASCTAATIKTMTPGTLTFATDKPVYEPWFVSDTPTNGKGFESAVAYAVATKLGYATSAVKWNRVTFNAAIAPGPKKFDADVNEFSITAARKKVVDFTTGYYDVTQAIVTTTKSKAAGAHSIADLAKLKLGAQIGTTSYTAITDVIKPTQKPGVYNDNDLARQALSNGQIDALVVDLPTAFYITSAQLKNGLIVGQLPAAAKPEQFGMVLNKDSQVTACLSYAIDALRADGTLSKLAKTWLAESAKAPELS